MEPKAITVDGIELSPRRDMADDYDVVEAVAVCSDPDAPDYAKTLATVRIYRALLGGDYDRVKAELRERNGGKLPVSAMIDFMAEVMGKMGEAKN